MTALQKKIEREAKKLQKEFRGETFTSKSDVADWMRKKSASLELEGFSPADIFHILKLVAEKNKA